MKKKEKDSLHSLAITELRQKIKEAEDALSKLRIERAISQSKNTRQGRKLRQIIALAQTMIREKELTHE